VAVPNIEEIEALAERLGLEPDADTVEETCDALLGPGGWSKKEAPNGTKRLRQ
jgi:hypothetical protein